MRWWNAQQRETIWILEWVGTGAHDYDESDLNASANGSKNTQK